MGTNVKTKNNSELLNELLSKQLKDVSIEKKLQFTDLKRICKYIDKSIFDENICCLWDGYVTNTNNINKGIYINFYFKGNKMALHRLLYVNFVGPLSSNEYLKFNCDNKGRCCNVMHLKKFKYIMKSKELAKKTIEVKEVLINKTNDISLKLSFD